MNILELSLRNFRNYDRQQISLSPHINVICGENAQGKTNLLESVYLLSGGKSFRTRLDREMVRFDTNEAEIEAKLFSHERDQKINMRLTPGQARKISVNGVKKNTADLSDCLSTVLFCPDDLNLIREGASVRRRMIDHAISQIRPRYRALLTEYNRNYEQKTRILRDWREKPSLLYTLDSFSDALCRLSAQMIRYRASYLKRLEEAAVPIHADFSGSGERLSFHYQTVSTVTDPFASASDIYEQVCRHQQEHRRAELDSALCLTGIHKDDIDILINQKSARSFASQGQARTAALSMKLAEREIYLQETGEYPVLLLDDVLSELDEKRQEYVLNRIGGGQTIISCCEDAGISERTGAAVFSVKDGVISPCI